MKRFLIGVLFIFLSFCPSFGLSENDLIGYWYGESEDISFAIFFQRIGDKLVGHHESDWVSEKRIDTTIFKDKPSIEYSSIFVESCDEEKKEFKVSFNSGYDERSFGSATISMIDNKNLSWLINKEDGENYIAKTMKMIKLSDNWLPVNKLKESFFKRKTVN